MLLIKFKSNKYVIQFTLLMNILFICFMFFKFINIPSYLKVLVLPVLVFMLIVTVYKKRILVYVYSTINIMLLCFFCVFKFLNVDTNYGFYKYFGNPVLGEKSTGSFFDPYVIQINDEYVMYFSYRMRGNIAMSKSLDGINWSEPITVLDRDLSSSWEYIINRATVIYKDEKYMMWYTGQMGENSAIGYAESSDGIHFNRVSINPIIVPEFDYEKKSIMNPHVIYDEEENVFKMWYAGGEIYEPDVICYATSKDGIIWEKYASNPVLTKSADSSTYDSYKVGAVDVHKLNSHEYLMFYIGYTNLYTARIMFATSSDGINWQKSNNYVIEGTKFSFDENAVYKPSAIYNEKEHKWYLWYNGRKNNSEFIGLAYNNTYDFFKK